MFHRCILLLIFIGSALYGKAQNPVFKTIDANTGLPSNAVYDALQDKKGYIWIAHDKGLSRYDGITIKNYKQSSVQSKAVSNIMLSSKGIVYCQDFIGNFYYVKNDSVVREMAIPTVGNYCEASITDNDELIYQGVKENGLCIFNLSTKQNTQYPKKGYYFMYAEKNKALISKDTIFQFTPSGGFEYLGLNPASNKSRIKLYFNKLYFFYNNSDDGISIALNNALANFNVLPKGYVIQNIRIIDQIIWICTTTGAFALDQNLKPLYNGYCFFNNNSISNIFKDYEGNYWFSTLDKGVFFVSNLSSRLYGFNNLSITSLLHKPDSDYLLAGTSRSQVLNFDLAKKVYTVKFTGNKPHDINQIFADDATNDIFISGLNLQNTTGSFAKEAYIPAVKNIAKISDGVFAFSQSGNYGYFYTKNNSAPEWLINNTEPFSTFNARAFNTAILRCRWVDFDQTTQTLYAVTSLGVYAHNAEGNVKIKLNNEAIFANTCLAKNGRLFLSTFNNGLLIAEKNTITKQLNKSMGLLSNTVLKVFVDQTNVWMLFENGVQMYSLMNGSLLTFKKDDGLANAEYKDLAVVDSTVYLATTLGLNTFAASNEMSKIVSRIVLDKIAVNNRAYYNIENLHLQPDENNVAIDFSVLNYANTDDISVLYKINNGEWLELEKDSRTINLNALSSGNYTIQIMPQSSRFVSNVNTLVIKFSIKAKMYQTWWFWLLIGILILGALWLYYRRVLHQQKERSKLTEEKLILEQELQKSMLASIKSQMNPHFLFNALNTIQSYIYTNDKENASVYLGKFSELTRLILDMSNKETVTLSEEIKALELYLALEKLRFEDGLEYTIEVDKTIDTETTAIPSMLIQPYVENAIKHGLLHKKGVGKVALTFKKNEDNTLKITIDDNGIGREKSAAINATKAKKHESFAVNANKKRLELLNRDRKHQISLSIVDKYNEVNEPMGTLVTMYI